MLNMFKEVYNLVFDPPPSKHKKFHIECQHNLVKLVKKISLC